MNLFEKSKLAKELADDNYELDRHVVSIYRLISSKEHLEQEPIKLLTVNSYYNVPLGIEPLYISSNYVNIEVSINEFKDIQKGILKLPYDWAIQYPVLDRNCLDYKI